MSLSPQEVTQQRQALNDEAYFAVLKALLAANNGQLLLTRKLRRELGISDEQHKVWHDELRAAMQAGAIQYCTLDRTRTVGHTQQGRASITGLDQQPAPVVDRSMVGYKANVVTSTTGQWQEGLITDFVDNHIIVTFNLGTDNEFDERVKWEQSPYLQMLSERVEHERGAQTVHTDGVAISVMFLRPKPAAPPAELPRMGRGLGAVNLLAHLHAEWLGVDPGKSNMATVAHEERSAAGTVVSVRHWKLTAGQYYRDSGITRQAQATKTWLARVKPQLTALSRVSSKPSSLASYRRFADTVLATYDAMWAEVSKPRWANAKFRLYCGKMRVVASFWAKVKKQAQKRWPDRILALAYGAASFSGSGSIGCRGVPVSQMRKEAVKQFGAGRVVLVEEFRTSRVKTSVVDTTDEGAVKTFFAAIPAGSIHHLVCTTGPSLAGGSFLDVPMDKIRAQYDAKLFSAMHVAKYGAPALADGGSLTFLSGALARRPGNRRLCCWLLSNRGSAALATVNAALDALAKALAGELGPRLRVNCLSPGLVDTEMWDSMPEVLDDANADVKAKMLAGFGASIPAGRAGTIDDIGHGAVVLAESMPARAIADTPQLLITDSSSGTWGAKPQVPCDTRWASYISSTVTMLRVWAHARDAVSQLLERQKGQSPPWAVTLSQLLQDNSLLLRLSVVAVVGESFLVPELMWASKDAGLHAFELYRHTQDVLAPHCPSLTLMLATAGSGKHVPCSWATSVAAVGRGEARMSKTGMDLNVKI
ncbi:hypothetical protein QJQ45_004394 [Haematococcus lacustris]|nr:hypothetical protein QJQ45_004394 [Haematococcus lacustris]